MIIQSYRMWRYGVIKNNDTKPANTIIWSLKLELYRAEKKFEKIDISLAIMTII